MKSFLYKGLSLLIICCVVVSFTACTSSESESKIYQVNMYNTMDLKDSVEVNGNIDFAGITKYIKTDILTASVSKINFKVGDYVKKDDIVCILDDSYFQEQKELIETKQKDADTKYNSNVSMYTSKIDQATKYQTLQLDSVKLDISNEKAQRDKYVAQKETADSDYKNSMSLADSYLASYNETQNAEDYKNYSLYLTQAEQYKQSAESYSNQISICDSNIEKYEMDYQITLNETNQQIEEAKSNLALYKSENQNGSQYDKELAQIKKSIENCNIKADCDGMITKVFAQAGIICSDGIVCSINSSKEYCVKAQISQSDYERVQTGLSVEIDYGSSDVISGTVDSVSKILNEDGKCDVIISLDSYSDTNLVVGMEVKTEIFIMNFEKVKAVKNNSLLKNKDGSYYVYKAEESSDGNYYALKSEVSVGDVCDDYTIILDSDLKTGELIVAYPDSSLQAGSLIQIQTNS